MEGDPVTVFSDEERLRKYSLALPAPYRICRMLTAGGLPVADSMDEEEIARRILVELSKTSGAGMRLTHLSAREFPKKSGEERGRIEAQNVTHVYNPRSPFETYALCGASLTIDSGEFFGIIGYTGSGKSTFVQHLNALIKLPCAEKKYREKRKKHTEAEPLKLTVAGFDLTKKTTDFRALRKAVGMVFQYPEYQLFAETVFEDVAFGLRNFSDRALSQAETEQAVREALEMVGLCYEEVKDRSPFELSGGQKRRVAIAGVIVTKPQILVLDEPAAGLDPLGKTEIMQLLHRLHETWCETLIVVSHDMDEIAEHCTRVAAFSGGKVMACGTPEQLFASRTRVREMGLDCPFAAKLTHSLSSLGIELSSDLSQTDFVKSLLLYAQRRGEHADRTGGGADV